MKIQNNFIQGKINKDIDERLVPPGVLIDAENFMVASEEGGAMGVGKLVLGNFKVTNLNIAGAEVIGSLADDSNERLFYFVKGALHDYVIEYNVDTDITQVLLQSTAGTGVLKFNVNHRITHSDLFVSTEDDSFLSWTDGYNPPRIVGVERAKTYAIDGFTDTEISVMKPSPIFAPKIELTSVNLDTLSNFLEDKFLSFAYRYRYEGGFYSSISSWSQVAFLPKSFALDFQTYENFGMANLANAVDITFNVGSRHVTGVDLLFKESSSPTVYVIDKFVKTEEGWNTNNADIKYTFKGNKIYSVLPESQYFNSFNNVPLTSKCQSKVGNRLMYANFTEGRDIDTNTKLSVDYVSTSLVEDQQFGLIKNLSSLTTYPNIVDFEKGTSISGLTTDPMNYATNVYSVALTSGEKVELSISMNPKGLYESVPYSVFVVNNSDNSVLFSQIGVTGDRSMYYERSGSSIDMAIYVTSDSGIIYDISVDVEKLTGLSSSIYKYRHEAFDQLVYPNSLGYGSTYVGNTIIKKLSEFNMSSVDFKSGSQLRFDLTLRSSLVYETNPSVTMFYNLTRDYTSLSDFITNSGFVNYVENVFSNSFIQGDTSFTSKAGTYVSSVGFKVTTSGNTLIIENPSVVYSVLKPNGPSPVNETDFYLSELSSFGVYTANAFASMHSNRDYTCDVIYMDNEGRKTTVLTGGDTTIYIPASESENINKLRVNTLSNPPSWAKYYKFVIKENKKEYNTVFGNVVYSEGIYRWIQLVGENKDKVREGDTLILKKDYSGPLDYLVKIKVLEVASKKSDFIAGNTNSSNVSLIEEEGLYFKIKQGDFDMTLKDDAFITYQGFESRRYASRSRVYTSPLFGEYDGATYVAKPIPAGTAIRFFARLFRFRNGGFDDSVTIPDVATRDYADIKEWWEDIVADHNEWIRFRDERLGNPEGYGFDLEAGIPTRFYIRSLRDGVQRSEMRVNVSFDVNYSGGALILETDAIEKLDAPYYETVETYTVNNGKHNSLNAQNPNEHILTNTFNCYTFGNGCESNTIKDLFAGKKFFINSNATTISEDLYRKMDRYADITYSGVYQESTNVNKLNEFNLSLANYKDDIEKKYGPIIRLSADENDLLVIQEDKWSKVLFGKDMLYNSDATTNMTRTNNVLGQQVMYSGDYGISSQSESFDEYGTNTFATDVKRGVVLKLNASNGLSELSNNGMRDYFKRLFRDNKIDNIIGEYDSFYNIYLCNIKYTTSTGEKKYVTWVYSDVADGFATRQTFNPEEMVRVNNKLISFKNGEVYKHNHDDINNYSTFYGVACESSFAFNFSQEPSTRKNFKTIEIEGTDSWDITLKTDLQKGYINSVDLQKKEGVWYGYVRGEGNNAIDTATLSVQGLGVVSSVSGNNIIINDFSSELVSVGDFILNTSLAVVGVITGISGNQITVNVTPSVSVNEFLISSKPQSIETSGLLGYYMRVDAKINKNTYSEVYSLNSEVVKSYS